MEYVAGRAWPCSPTTFSLQILVRTQDNYGDRFPKQVPKAKASRGVRGVLSQIIFWTLKVHFLGS